MKKAALTYLSLFALCCFSTLAGAAPKLINPTTDTLTVGIAGAEPFVINSGNNNFEGVSIEIWQQLANRENWAYNYKAYASVDDALNALQNAQVDLVVGPVSITSKRATSFSFSQPYYQSSLAIASKQNAINFWGRIKPFFSLKLLTAVGIFLLLLAGVGTLLWLAEHKTSPQQFSDDPKKGIGNGMWLAIVTMSTTGYGDMAPVTLRGRVIAGTWMIISLIFASSMIAGIASTLTLTGLATSTIPNIEKLAGKKTATIIGSPSEAFIKNYRTKSVGVKTLNDAMALLTSQKVDAVVYDRPQLLYFKNKHQEEDIYIAKAEYYKQGYGFAFARKSELVYPVNLALLKLAEEQTISHIVSEYLGKQ